MNNQLAILDTELRIAVHTWRWMRIDGAGRDTKRRHLAHIDLLLDQRLIITRAIAHQAEALT